MIANPNKIFKWRSTLFTTRIEEWSRRRYLMVIRGGAGGNHHRSRRRSIRGAHLLIEDLRHPPGIRHAREKTWRAAPPPSSAERFDEVRDPGSGMRRGNPRCSRAGVELGWRRNRDNHWKCGGVCVCEKCVKFRNWIKGVNVRTENKFVCKNLYFWISMIK